MRCGTVSVFGRANAGKSTIINKALGFKLLPVSEKPQTTRDNVRAILTDEENQIIFVDTPGIFKPHGKLGSILLRDAYNSMEGIDMILYVVDASIKVDEELPKKIALLDVPVIVCFNKIDLVSLPLGQKRLLEYKSMLPKAEFVEMSCKDDFGIEDMLEKIKSHLPEREFEFSPDYVSDRPKEYIIAEIIREKCMRLLDAEVPHSIYIDIKEVKEDEIMEVYADIIVEKESERGIVIGKNGSMIRKIRTYAQQSIKGYFGLPCHIDLLVKCIPNWRNDEKYLKKFGFEDSLK